jgi:WD40 repeat protein
LDIWLYHLPHIFLPLYPCLSIQDQSVKFWQIGGLSTDPVAGDPKSTPPTSVPIQSVSLQAENGIAISSDSDGVVKVWDISTGLCKASFQTPAKGCYWRDAQMIDGRLIFVWLGIKGIHIWDTDEGELLQIVECVNGLGYIWWPQDIRGWV